MFLASCRRHYITKDEKLTSFYRAEYVFSDKPDDSIAENLKSKLVELYGKSDTEGKTKHDSPGISHCYWSPDHLSISLSNTTSLSISYLWSPGYSRVNQLQEIYDNLKKMEEIKKEESVQNSYSTSTDGL